MGTYDDWKLMSPEDEFEKFNPSDPHDFDCWKDREEAEAKEAFFQLEEGILEFSLEEAVRLLVAHYGPQNTRRHVTAFLDTLEEEDHARTF